MDQQLYHQEEKQLQNFKELLKNNEVFVEDIDNILQNYEDLLNESKVITRISDRLQKKLDKANIRIQTQNGQITKTNSELKETIGHLARARVGKKASTIMFTAAIFLFVTEEYYLSSIIEQYVNLPYISLAIKGLIALFLKFVESGLEGFYLKREKAKIMNNSVVASDRRFSRPLAAH